MFSGPRYGSRQQAVMHYNRPPRHRLTVLVAYPTTLTYASTNNQWADPACPLVSSSKTKPCQFNSVQFSYVTLSRLYRDVSKYAHKHYNEEIKHQ